MFNGNIHYFYGFSIYGNIRYALHLLGSSSNGPGAGIWWLRQRRAAGWSRILTGRVDLVLREYIDRIIRLDRIYWIWQIQVRRFTTVRICLNITYSILFRMILLICSIHIEIYTQGSTLKKIEKKSNHHSIWLDIRYTFLWLLCTYIFTQYKQLDIHLVQYTGHQAA